MFKKRIISIVMTSLLFLQCGQWAPEASSPEGELIFREDCEGIANGARPEYGSFNWTGDNKTAGYTVGAVEDGANKALEISYIGTGGSGISSLVIYRNMSIKSGELHTFYTSLKTNDDNSYKRLFLRSSTGTTIDLIRMQGGRLTVAGEKMGMLQKNHWYQVMVQIDDTSKKASLYIDGILKAGIYLTWDLTNISIRADVVGDGTEDVKTALYLDNTAYTKGNYPISFENSSVQPNTDLTNDTNGGGGNTEDNKISFPEGTLVMCLDNTGAYFGNKKTELSAKPINKNGVMMLPIRPVCEKLGGTLEWKEEASEAILTYNNDSISLKNGENPIVKGKEEKDKTLVINGTMYLSMETVASIFNRDVSLTSAGAIIISEKGVSVSSATAEEAVKTFAYSRPNAEQILNSYKSQGEGVHPRVFVDKARVKKIKGWIGTDQNFTTWYANVKKKANECLDEPACVYELRDGERLLYVSRDVWTNVLNPALVYLIEGGEQYKERVWKELSAAAAFPDWHPTHFLDTAEMLLPFAVGYDWLYDSWTPEQRKILQTAILRLGLDAAQSAYDGTAQYGSESGAEHNRMGWTKDTSNWGLVCNSGVMVGALAIMGDCESEYTAKIVEQALGSMEYPLSAFAPYGIYPEGVSYWEYATRLMSYGFSTLKNTTGTYYSYDSVPGLSATPYFPVYHTGPKGSFNYGDASEGAQAMAVLLWFADLLGDPALNDIQLGRMEQYKQSGGAYGLLFYNPELEEKNLQAEKNRKFSSIETAMLVNNWGSSDANYIGIKGGISGSGHGDLDAGVFVLDSFGERWTVDYGTDNYNLPNYFFWPGRGDYYRKRAEGHSTLVINPDSGLDQVQGSKSPILDMQFGQSGGYALVDLTPAYANNATKANRLISLYNDRTRFMVQDQVECTEKSDIWWLMQTKASIEISEDGKSAILTIGDKHMLCILQASDKNAVLTYTDAVGFPTSPAGTGQAENPGCYRLAVEAKDVKKLNLRVTFVPYIEGETPDNSVLKLESIEQIIGRKTLNSNDDVYAKADAILVNGKPLEHFDSQQFFYTLELEANEEEPELQIQSNYAQKTEKALNNSLVKMTVSDPEGRLKDGVYLIYISRSPITPKYEKPSEGTLANAVEVSASEIAEAENVPQNTVDKNNETKWSANGKQWILYDLGGEKTLTGVGTLWMNNSSRRQAYSIDISADATNWETVFEGTSASESKDMEYFNLTKDNVRYVRITVNGSSAGSWSSLLETEIYAK